MRELETAVFAFAQLTQDLADDLLDSPWVWKDYEEGVRFAFFRNLEDLNLLSASLATQRQMVQPITTAQGLLAQYKTAYRDLQAVLLGVDDLKAEQLPAENEWPVRKALLHIVQAEGGFLAIVDYAVTAFRAHDGRSLEISDEEWNTYWEGDPFEELSERGTFFEITAYYDKLHDRVLERLVNIQENEIQIPVVYWESQPMPVDFRLGRFTSHLCQHTIQVEKILSDLELGPQEGRRLLRLIFRALAGVEGWLLGAPNFGHEQCLAVANEIVLRTREISQIIE